jgi:hypothetical protein
MRVPNRVPTGCVDATVGVHVLDGSGVPVLIVSTWRRSPAEVGEDTFIETAERVSLQLHYAPLLLEQIRNAVGHVLTRVDTA